MAERIARHRARRPPAWTTVEATDPRGTLTGAGAEGATILVDGLTGWLAAGGSLDDVAALARAAADRPGVTIVVADEVGLGGVALTPVGRVFADLAGDAAQTLAAAAIEVWLVAAGQGLPLKPKGPPLPHPVEPALRIHGDRQAAVGALDFAVSVVPGGPPPAVQAALEHALAQAGAYPDSGPATRALAQRHCRDPAEVLVLNGAAEAFWLLATVLRPARAVCVHPTFTEGEVALRALGCPVERAWRDPEDFRLDPASIQPGADLVLVANPNNPTGTLDPAGVVAGLARPGRVLVVDEAFIDFVHGQAQSLAGRADLPGTVVVRSLTKVWGLAGLRAGYLLGPPDLVARLAATRQPWSVNGAALAALELYGRGAGMAEVAAPVAAAREELAAQLAGLPGVRVWPSAANFLLLAVPDGLGTSDALRAQGIAVRSCDSFPGLSANHLRVAVRTPQDNARLVAALARALA